MKATGSVSDRILKFKIQNSETVVDNYRPFSICNKKLNIFLFI
jgi:hypothetical protein